MALHDGTPPLLRYPGLSGDQVYVIFGSQRTHSRLAELQPDPALASIAADVSTVAAFLNSKTKHHKLEPIIYQDLVVDLGYRLLEYRSLCDLPGPDTLQDALHLALTAFMTTFILQFGHRRRIRFNRLAGCLKAALHGDWTYEPGNRSFRLWALVAGGISEFGTGDYQWLLPQIRHTAAELGILRWEELQAAMLFYPWVRVLHDEPAKRLWQLASGI